MTELWSSSIRVRWLVLVPSLFLLSGLATAGWAVALSPYISPMPGLAVGGVIVAVSAYAIRALWLARAAAPVALLASGAVTLAAELLSRWVFPIVNASSEPLSLFARLWYPTSLILIVMMTVVAAWATRRWLRAA